MILDLEYVKSPEPFKGVLLYRYRSGVMRSRVRAVLGKLAGELGGVLLPVQEAAELKAAWSSSGLLDGVRFCDLTATNPSTPFKFSEFEEVLDDEPGQPTAIFVKAANDAALEKRVGSSGIVLLEEPIVQRSNIEHLVSLLELESDFKTEGELSKQKAFRKYFNEWIAERSAAPLPDLMHEFDKAVLFYADVATNEFVPPTDRNREDDSSHQIVRAVRRFVSSADVMDSATLLRALEKKMQGATALQFLNEMCRASLIALDVGPVDRMTLQNGATPHARVHRRRSIRAILWAALLLVYGTRSFRAGSEQLESETSDALVLASQLCSDFGTRSGQLAKDPLAGFWSELVATIGPLASRSPDETDNLEELLIGLRAVVSDEVPWLAKLSRLICVPQNINCGPCQTSQAQPQKRSDSVCDTFGGLLGQSSVLREVRRRFGSENHETPLLLVGPEGSGKRTISRIYAKSLLCQQRAPGTIESCGRCEPCVTFDEYGSLGYFEIDAAHSNALTHARDKITDLGASSLARNRIAVIRNPEGVSDAIDAFLKSFEDGAIDTTFLILTRDEGLVRAAAVSRATICRLRALTEGEANELLARWIDPIPVPECVRRLIRLHGGHLPGMMWQAWQQVHQADAFELTSAKKALGLEWAGNAIAYWQALLGAEAPEMSSLQIGQSISTQEAVARSRVIIQHIGGQDVGFHPALLGHEAAVSNLAAMIRQRAEQASVTAASLWSALARHWLSDEAVDVESFYEAGRRSRDIVVRGS